MKSCTLVLAVIRGCCCSSVNAALCCQCKWSFFIYKHPMSFYSRPVCSCPTFRHACPPPLSFKCDVLASSLTDLSEVSDSRAARRGDRVARSASIYLLCLCKIQFPPLLQASPLTLIHLLLLMNPRRLVRCCKQIICFS